MGKELRFIEDAGDELNYWMAHDPKVCRRIGQLITDIRRNGHKGIGKPEPLKHKYQGWWSRRINDEHRLVYRIENNDIYILHCRYHYDD